jgi:hypothetical protein
MWDLHSVLLSLRCVASEFCSVLREMCRRRTVQDARTNSIWPIILKMSRPYLVSQVQSNRLHSKHALSSLDFVGSGTIVHAGGAPNESLCPHADATRTASTSAACMYPGIQSKAVARPPRANQPSHGRDLVQRLYPTKGCLMLHHGPSSSGCRMEDWCEADALNLGVLTPNLPSRPQISAHV